MASSELVASSSSTIGASLSRARDADALALASGERRAALAYDGVKTQGQRLDEVQGRSTPRSVAHLLVSRVEPPHADVVRNGALEEEHVLEHDGDAREHIQIGAWSCSLRLPPAARLWKVCRRRRGTLPRRRDRVGPAHFSQNKRDVPSTPPSRLGGGSPLQPRVAH